LPAFDAVATLVRLLSLLAASDQPLSGVVAELPPTFIVRQDVATPFRQKGLVMRTLVEQADPTELSLLDGLKTVDDTGWTLVLPDPELPITRVCAEGTSCEEANERVRRAADTIEEILIEGTA
jgi:phosphomannomutase